MGTWPSIVPSGGAALAIPAGMVVFMYCPWTTFWVDGLAFPTFWIELNHYLP